MPQPRQVDEGNDGYTDTKTETHAERRRDLISYSLMTAVMLRSRLPRFISGHWDQRGQSQWRNSLQFALHPSSNERRLPAPAPIATAQHDVSPYRPSQTPATGIGPRQPLLYSSAVAVVNNNNNSWDRGVSRNKRLSLATARLGKPSYSRSYSPFFTSLNPSL